MITYTRYKFKGEGIPRESYPAKGIVVDENLAEYKILDLEDGKMFWRIKDNVSNIIN
ncbi:hypothetical protein [Metabacillus fastidiosus]|uniref:hypothetical protein n=1 Tax=Metabacillus fastidiosus TaxID=1458 RepID=UPI003D2E7CA7